MSAAICGVDVNKKNPGYRFAHPGYLLDTRERETLIGLLSKLR
jgi:hypothetical protein